MSKNKYSNFWIGDNFFDSDRFDEESTNSTDVMALASCKRAVKNFVNIVTNKDIKVTFTTAGDSYTDGEVVTISSKVTDSDFDPIVGLALHEGSHIKLTDFDVLKSMIGARFDEDGNCSSEYFMLSYDYCKSLINKHSSTPTLWDSIYYITSKVKDLLNVIEDRRIDHYIYTTAPGYKGYYHSMYEKYFNAKIIDRGLKSSEYRENTWDSYMFRIINLTNKNRDLDALPVLRQIWDLIDLKNISRLKNTTEVLSLAFEVFKLIEDTIPASNSDSKERGESEQQETEDESNDNSGNGSQGGDSDGDDESKNDSQGGDYTDGDADGEESNGNKTSKGNGSLSDRQRNQLEKAIKKQKEFGNGNVKKKRLSKKDNDDVETISESGVDQRMAGKDYSGYYTDEITKTKVTVISKLTKKLCESNIFHHILNRPNHWRSERMAANISKGVQLGTVLGKRLKVRSEERTLVTPRMKSGRISGRLIHELGMGNTDIFDNLIVNKHKPALIHISVDASGSMSGELFDKTQTAVVAIAKAASMTPNMDVVISYRSCHEANRKSTPLVLIGYDSRVDKFSKITSLFKCITAGGTTPEGLCFEAILDEITKGDPSTDRYFINFSDGMPCYSSKEIYYNGSRAIEHTSRQVKKIRKSGVKVLSYFLSWGGDYGISTNRHVSQRETDFKTMYGNSAQMINITSMIPLAKSLNKMFE